jgi:hypothetical protein
MPHGPHAHRCWQGGWLWMIRKDDAGRWCLYEMSGQDDAEGRYVRRVGSPKAAMHWIVPHTHPEMH